jgi:hypothetical protein
MPDPKIIDDTDAIVQIDTDTICGTDPNGAGGHQHHPIVVGS